MSGSVKEKNRSLPSALIFHISVCLTFRGEEEQYTYRPPRGSNSMLTATEDSATKTPNHPQMQIKKEWRMTRKS